MATTTKELIEILQKYTDPEEIVIWQYYTRHDFENDEPALTKKQFERIADKVERWELWTPVYEGIEEAISELQVKAGN
jgi:cytochrome oxidase Cu insertion factor (SCO1/SenC/PrrC family)